MWNRKKENRIPWGHYLMDGHWNINAFWIEKNRMSKWEGRRRKESEVKRRRRRREKNNMKRKPTQLKMLSKIYIHIQYLWSFKYILTWNRQYSNKYTRKNRPFLVIF